MAVKIGLIKTHATPESINMMAATNIRLCVPRRRTSLSCPPPTLRASPPCCGCRSDRSLIEGFALKYLGILRCCRRTVTIGELSAEIPLSSLQSTPSFDFKPLPLFLPLNFAPRGPDATLRWFVQKRRARAWRSPRQHVKKMEKGTSVSLRRHPQNDDLSTYSLPTLVQHKQGALAVYICNY